MRDLCSIGLGFLMVKYKAVFEFVEMGEWIARLMEKPLQALEGKFIGKYYGIPTDRFMSTGSRINNPSVLDRLRGYFSSNVVT